MWSLNRMGPKLLSIAVGLSLLAMPSFSTVIQTLGDLHQDLIVLKTALSRIKPISAGQPMVQSEDEKIEQDKLAKIEQAMQIIQNAKLEKNANQNAKLEGDARLLELIKDWLPYEKGQELNQFKIDRWNDFKDQPQSISDALNKLNNAIIAKWENAAMRAIAELPSEKISTIDDIIEVVLNYVPPNDLKEFKNASFNNFEDYIEGTKGALNRIQAAIVAKEKSAKSITT